ncbi:MAG: AAA family ATPase [Candidatus Nomurabacteria bacterium]|nr:AAA family ATPase [Candidatus Nomurabacteria bacterium]
MRLKTLEINGFKSFAQKTVLEFNNSIVCVVGPNGSGKSNVVEALRYVLGEQSMKSMRGKSGLDLIFKGSKSLSKGSRAGVTIYFDNSDKVFKLSNSEGGEINLNYETVSISREVYSDGLNKYILNGSEVRLKDIHNLLASVNIGSSGHHIISQGEADRILNANMVDRREMVEDALGLKIYQYKIKESERKLERTEENMKEVTLQRRENAPHLNFLKKQVEKFEKAKEMQADLAILYKEYLSKESVYLENEKNTLSLQKDKLKSELENVASKISATEDNNSAEGNKKINALRVVEGNLNSIRGMKSEMERKLGRIEGMIEMETRRAEQNIAVVEISQEEIKAVIADINNSIDEAISKNDVSEVKPILERIKSILKKFSSQNTEKSGENIEIKNLKQSQQEILEEMKGIESKEKDIAKSAELLKQEINKEMEALRDLEREKFTWKVRQQELSSALELTAIKEGNLKSRTEAFLNEIKEGVALIGQEILAYKDEVAEALLPPAGGSKASATTQEELKRKIERIKIKLEDAGLGSGAEVLKEFKEVSERDGFLAKEMEDLAKSIESLEKLIADLKEKIDLEFKEGVRKINVEFQEFFSLMFGGGTGSLSIVVENKKKRKNEFEEDESVDVESSGESKEEIVFEKGIEINVSLPHKKVKELNAFSGGERSLTSIALLFAMSQVNPPPFLVLDETDAALDEANSRKYGDMLEKLSKHSQLIVVTHNRETMSRAGVLYGVTIGSNGASKLLSVKFDEATAIAK